MPNKNYLRGRRFEYQVAKDARERGWKVIRASGSHGEYDLVIYKDGDVGFIQCKVVQTPAEAQRLIRDWETEPKQFDCPHIIECMAVKVHRGEELQAFK